MQILIDSTDQLTTVDGVPVRAWKGTTDDGVECMVFVHRIAVHKSQDQARFQAVLLEQLPPGRQVPLSEVLT
jgi:hypothetical protein